jgi:hypothetical protein
MPKKAQLVCWKLKTVIYLHPLKRGTVKVRVIEKLFDILKLTA